MSTTRDEWDPDNQLVERTSGDEKDLLGLREDVNPMDINVMPLPPSKGYKGNSKDTPQDTNFI